MDYNLKDDWTPRDSCCNPEEMSWEELEKAHQESRMSLIRLVAQGGIAPGQAQTTWEIEDNPTETHEEILTAFFED